MTELAKQTAHLIADETRATLKRCRTCCIAVGLPTQSLSTGALDRMWTGQELARGRGFRLDADPWLLNVENGTIDLRTGRREEHDPRDLLTKMAPGPRGPRGEVSIVQKVPQARRSPPVTLTFGSLCRKLVGYSLTGITTEQVLFFVHGKSGNNGKSTLVNLIRDMLGDYGLHTPTETLLVKQYDNAIPADLARLDGARMVTAIEANLNRHLDEARIKSMTGGEPITARFMRQRLFSIRAGLETVARRRRPASVRGTDQSLLEARARAPPHHRDPACRT